MSLISSDSPGCRWYRWGQVVSHQSGITSTTRPGQLNLAEYPVSGIVLSAAHCETELQQKIDVIWGRAANEIQAENREGLELSRFRDMLIAKLGESVICRDEEVVSTDMGCIVKWWTVGNLIFRQISPDHLTVVAQ